MEKRFESLDIAKCLAILAVIALHTIVYIPVAAGTSLLMGATMLFFFMVYTAFLVFYDLFSLEYSR